MTKHPSPNSFGYRLRKARNEAQMSQEELALAVREDTGIRMSAASISQYENNRVKPGLDIIIALCRSLHVSPNKLLMGWADAA